MSVKWRENLDEEGKCGVLFVDLPKVFSLLRDFLLANLNAYGFDYTYIKLVSSFLSNRKYGTKINSSFSNWEDLLIDVPQKSQSWDFFYLTYRYAILFCSWLNLI